MMVLWPHRQRLDAALSKKTDETVLRCSKKLALLLRGRGATAVAKAGPRGERSSPGSPAGPPPLRGRQVSAESRVPSVDTGGWPPPRLSTRSVPT